MRRHGYSLAELLIGMTVSAMLMTVILAFSISGVKLWQRGAGKVDINESALVAMHAIRLYLGQSHVLSAYINPAGCDPANGRAGISFLSAVKNGSVQFSVFTPGPCSFKFACPGPAPCPCTPGTGCDLPPPCLPYATDGYPLWQQFEIIYWDSGTRTLRLGLSPLTPAVTCCNPGVTQPNPYRLSSYTPNLAKDQILASNISNLQFSVDQFDTPAPCPCPPFAPKPVACAPPCNPVGWPVPVTQTPIQNPIFVQISANLMPPGQVADAATVYGYTATLNSAVSFNNGFNLGANTGECATQGLGSCCQCFPCPCLPCP